MRMIDLSLSLEDSVSEPLRVTIEYQTHSSTAAVMASFFSATPDDLPDRLGWANEVITACSHNGTRVDAPYHYFPTSGGERARTIDELPLEWFFADGVVLDFSRKPKGSLIEPHELEHELQRIGYQLKPFDIVLIRTDADRFWGTADYFQAGAGMSAASTRWLIEAGIKVMGIDAWGWDQPFWAMRERFLATQDPAVIWEAHRVGRDLEYCQIEKLANLASLPNPYGFKVSCLPVKLKGGSAGWSRVVAILE
ncbi:cyclase family protein [Schlesneria sp. T3-172]|uniref:cyclase family protein n=1 Tax=Schlesneria sphaerica TaxID=3373610 RepID=UPI0037CABD21